MVNLSPATQNDRIFAALAHACVIVPFWGLIGAVGIWFVKREYSHFVTFQSLQAVIYQLTSILFGLCLGVFTFLLTLYLLTPPTAPSSGNDFQPLLILGPSLGSGLILLGYVGYGLWGAVSVLRGQNFQYLIIGSQLERRLSSAV